MLRFKLIGAAIAVFVFGAVYLTLSMWNGAKITQSSVKAQSVANPSAGRALLPGIYISDLSIGKYLPTADDSSTVQFYNGYWELYLSEQATFNLLRDSNIVLTGEYSVAGQQLYLSKITTPEFSQVEDAYRWIFDGETLTFSTTNEVRSEFSTVFTMQPFTYTGTLPKKYRL